MQPKPWSYTALDTFKTCPRQYQAKYVLKSVKEAATPEMLWGQQVHKHFEDRQAVGTPLPPELAAHEPYMVLLQDKPGVTFTEMKCGIDNKLKPCHFFDKDVWCRIIKDFEKVDTAAGMSTIVDYKGLPVSTLLSTPGGFVSMGDVQVGDLVHGSDGLAYPVLVKSQPQTRPCFHIQFDDKTTVICDNVHLWKLVDGSVVPVTELVAGKSRIPVAAPVEMPHQLLPLDPYVLGLWLADGKHTSGEVCKPDDEIWAEVRRRGYDIGENTGGEGKCRAHTILGIRKNLSSLGLFRNKHIPPVYLSGSTQQRVDLLRGLMDGDGSVNPTRKQVIFQNTNRALSLGVKELVESLGCRASMARTNYSGFGVKGIAYPVSWRPRHFNPFLLPRKASRVGAWGDGNSWFRRVTKIEHDAPRVTQCIGVGSPDNTYLCTESRIVTHNTGKPHQKIEQLALFALHSFVLNPQVELVNAQYYWTMTSSTSKKVWGRADIPDLWKLFIPHLKQYAEAYQTDIWQPRQSGLCNGWCPVRECEFWRPKLERRER